jgi:hypothetical protein
MKAPDPDFGAAVIIQQGTLCKRDDVPRRVLQRLMSEGEIDTIVIGRRFRFVLLSSLVRLPPPKATGFGA